jgi:YVTN family beta-propeller protein
LYVANDNGDTVAVIDTGADHVLEEISTTAPKLLFPNLKDFKASTQTASRSQPTSVPSS